MQLKHCSIQGNGKGILRPYKHWIESSFLYWVRLKRIDEDKLEKAERITELLSQIFEIMHKENLIVDKDFNDWEIKSKNKE
jgi:hypothetical protein